MGGVDPQFVASAMPLWIAAGVAAALVLIVCVLAFHTPRTERGASLARATLIVLGAVLCGSLVSAYFDNAAVRSRAAARRALELRAEELNAQALMPGSPLACLDAVAGGEVQAACRKDVFASPASVASAIAYVAARFALLADMAAYAAGGRADIDGALGPLRRTLQADPFGLLAHVLATRDGCTGESCPPLKLLHDASRVRKNLTAGTLDHLIAQYRSAWRKPDRGPQGAPAEVSTGGTAPARSAATAEAEARGSGHSKVDLNLPSAASIPPVSIMNPESAWPSAAPPATRAKQQQQQPPLAIGPQRTDPVWMPRSAPAKQ